MRVYVDHTHLWRRVTGVERLTLQLFSKAALTPLDVVPIRANSMRSMMFNQMVGLPALLALSRSSVLLCPGFPPMPLLHAFKERVIPYIHDLFLVSRRHDLNWRARAYSAWPFELAVRRFPRFIVNSADTGIRLAAYCHEDADIVVYRPPAENVFGLSPAGRGARPKRPPVLRLAAIGTIEPRKNLFAAAGIVSALRQRAQIDVTLEIVGRRGWGDDWAKLSMLPGVTLHGYQSDARAGAILASVDALICTSHAEGLGLPLLEAQYGGLPIIAPEQPVFREVLGPSGIYVDTADPGAAAATMAGHLAADDWRSNSAELAAANLRRWNAAAANDRERVIDMVSRLACGSERVTRQFGVIR